MAEQSSLSARMLVWMLLQELFLCDEMDDDDDDGDDEKESFASAEAKDDVNY